MKSLRLALVVVLAAAAVLWRMDSPTTVHAAGTDCSTYPEPRVFLESQAGWSDFDATSYGASQHVHSGTCFPYMQAVDGIVTFDVRSMLHNLPGYMLLFVRIQFASDQDGIKNMKIISPQQVCATTDCTFWNAVSVDVSGLPAGTWEVRVHSEARLGVRTSKPQILATSGWQLCVRDCAGGRTPQATDLPEGRGWYKDTTGSSKGYINGRYDSRTLPGVVSGTYCFPVNVLDGSGDEPTEASFVSIDPAFHATPELPGLVLIDQPGEYRGPVCVDTTQLANGEHKLFIRSESTAAISTGKLYGAFVVPFTVRNTP